MRVCVLQKYIASTQQFVLRFKCGYDKIVDGNAVVQLVDESEAFYASTKAKTKRCVAKANLEWGITEENPGHTRIVFDVDSSSKLQEVEDSIRLALAQRLEQKKAQEEAVQLKTQEDHERLVKVYAETLQKQRENVLRLQEEHAAAAQLQAKELATAKAIQETEAAAALLQQQQDEAAAQLQAQELAAAKLLEETEAAAALLQQQKDEAAAQLLTQELASAKLLEEIEAAAALLQQQKDEAAAQLQDQELAAAKLLEETEAAAALLQQQKDEAAALVQAKELAAVKPVHASEDTTKADGGDDSMVGEQQAGCGRGSYPRQDINKTIDYLRSYGMGHGW